MSEERLSLRIKDLSLEQRQIFLIEYNERKRSYGIYLILLFVFGLFGVHRFYFKKYATALLMAILSISWVFFVVAFLWVCIDLFRASTLVNKYNEKLFEEVMLLVKTTSKDN